MTGDNLGVTATGVRFCRTCRRASGTAWRRRRFAQRHGDHDVITTSDGRPYCRTCQRGAHDIDEIAVERAEMGEPPERLRVAERELAVVRLRSWNLTYREIGERVGCTLHTAWHTCNRLGVTDPADARAWMRAKAGADMNRCARPDPGEVSG
jgi:hypothetical protein